jgi:hypothetical protein
MVNSRPQYWLLKSRMRNNLARTRVSHLTSYDDPRSKCSVLRRADAFAGMEEPHVCERETS